jgi:hypothetical protein
MSSRAVDEARSRETSELSEPPGFPTMRFAVMNAIANRAAEMESPIEEVDPVS